MTEPTPVDKMLLLNDIVGSQATLEEKKVAAETLKALADYEKATAENRNHTKLSREETYRTIATVLVPLLTVPTLLITIYFQWSQSTATDRANEDGRWKTVVETMTKEAMTPTTDIVVVTGLLPFFSSERYKEQANDIMLLMSSRLSNALAFETLFKTAFGKATWENLPRLVRLDQILTGQLNEQLADEKRVAESMVARQQATVDRQSIFNRLLVPFGSVGPPGQPGVPVWAMPPGAQGPTDEELKTLQREAVEPRRGRWGPRGEPTIEDLRYFQGEVRKQKAIVAQSVATLLKETRFARAEVFADLTGFDFRAVNLERANLTNLVIDKVQFDDGVVNDAVLQPKSFSGSSWRGVQWWKANKISADLLRYLLATANPLLIGDDYWSGMPGNFQRPERGSVAEGIRERCERAKLKCDEGLWKADGGTSRK